ncbi:segregation/condensation protein A [Streptomyces cellulosae]|nr:segregation/condensation protein A [Streptomyces cellulosae]WTB84723.1 segregation/condensation protein A [Streptomyces cellulosae]WTC58959.1 segregation/condensation protein A [Streptomyces cellulosae]
MTSNDAAAPAPRRRPLGRGPAATPLAGVGAAQDASAEAAPAVTPEAPAADVPASEDAEARPEPAAGQAAPADEDAPLGASLTEPLGAPADQRPPAGAGAERAEHGDAAPTASAAVPAGEQAGHRPADAAPTASAAAPAGEHAGHRPADAGTPPVAPGASPAASGASDAVAPPVVPPEASDAAVRAPARTGASGGAPEGGGSGGEASDGEGDPGDGRFTVRLANFEGPFDLLLQLIAKHKLDVTEVALSKVTDEFMAYIRALGPDWDLDETTEFLVVAATLLDLKAARLLPAAEVEDEGDLALLEARDLLFARLLQYRAYKQIADIFSRRLDDEARRFPRTVGLEPHHAELLPDVVISIGPEGFAKLAVKAMQPKPRPQVYVDHIHAPLVSVQEQAGIVVARLKELGEAGFRALVEDTDDILTVVARFLALLELYREKAVALDQETALGELTVRWTGGDGDAVPAVTDEFDRPPEQPQEERTP